MEALTDLFQATVGAFTMIAFLRAARRYLGREKANAQEVAEEALTAAEGETRADAQLDRLRRQVDQDSMAPGAPTELTPDTIPRMEDEDTDPTIGRDRLASRNGVDEIHVAVRHGGELTYANLEFIERLTGDARRGPKKPEEDA